MVFVGIITKIKLKKMRKYTLFITFMLLSSLLFSQGSGDIPNGISMALKTGNSRELVKFLNDKVEMVILDEEGIYSKTQAEMILKDFFSDHEAKGFSLLHQGGKTGSKYGIGTLNTREGAFRVYFLLKTINNKSLIHQFRIEKENE